MHKLEERRKRLNENYTEIARRLNDALWCEDNRGKIVDLVRAFLIVNHTLVDVALGDVKRGDNAVLNGFERVWNCLSEITGDSMIITKIEALTLTEKGKAVAENLLKEEEG